MCASGHRSAANKHAKIKRWYWYTSLCKDVNVGAQRTTRCQLPPFVKLRFTIVTLSMYSRQMLSLPLLRENSNNMREEKSSNSLPWLFNISRFSINKNSIAKNILELITCQMLEFALIRFPNLKSGCAELCKFNFPVRNWISILTWIIYVKGKGQFVPKPQYSMKNTSEALCFLFGNLSYSYSSCSNIPQKSLTMGTESLYVTSRIHIHITYSLYRWHCIFSSSVKPE